MKLLAVAYHDLLIRLQDRVAVFLMFLAPLLIIAIAGISFGSGVSDSPLANKNLMVINRDKDISSTLLDEVLAGLQGTANAAAILPQDREATQRLIDQGAVLTLITIPENFIREFHEQNSAQNALDLEVYSHPTSEIDKAILSNFIQQLVLRSSKATESATTTNFVQHFHVEEPADIPQTSSTALTRFAPSMMIFFLMYSAFSGTRSMLKEKESGLLTRLFYLPVSVTTVLCGKMLAVLVMAILQITVLVLCSGLIMDIHWGQSLLGLFLILVTLCLAMTSFGVAIAVFSRDSNQAGIVGMGIILLFSGLGGILVPIEYFPTWMQHLSLMSPNRWGLDGILDLAIRENDVFGILAEAAALLGFTFIFFLFSFWKYQQQFAR